MSTTVVVFCRNQEEINVAVQNWVNVNGYKRIHTIAPADSAGHFLKDEEGNWAECQHTFNEGFRTVIVFQLP